MSEQQDRGSGDKPWARFWSRLWKVPRAWFLLGIPIGGFIAFVVGVLFWGGFHTAMHLTNNLEFCTSCHEMDYVYEEYKQSVHYQNPEGVRAICTDCHVPKEWGPMVLRKIQATHDLWGHLMGTIDTKEKFLAHREQMAEHVWAQMKATDSRECRNCHSFEAMKLADQGRSAQRKHSPEWLAKTGDTCIDCHKGVVHHLPQPGA